jgi:hypothetical protein
VTLEGVVEARNDTGIRVDGEWINRSKFRPVDLPPAGARVRAEVDAKGYLKSVDVLEGASCDSQPVTARDERITRLAVLKAAAAFAADRSDIKSADVLTIADRWLAWVETE